MYRTSSIPRPPICYSPNCPLSAVSTYARCTVLAVLLWAIPASAYAGALRTPLDLELTFQGKDIRGPYHLGDDLLFRDTEEVLLDEVLQARGTDYRIDYRRNEITFVDPIRPATAIQIHLKRIPLNLKTTYRRRKTLALDVSNSPERPGPSERRSEPTDQRPYLTPSTSRQEHGADNLQVAGSKTFSVSVGSNRDLSVDQSLHMDLSGRIGSDLEVFALLSDQNTPIPPEGDTRALRELDKVLVRVTGNHLSAALGDVDVALNATEFGAYRRRLEGIRGDLNLPHAEATVVGARSGGEFASTPIAAVEGSQGPYQLTAEDGSVDIVVQPGTERIWLDGELLARGRNEDYTIEYGTGRITFTARRPIAADDRIVADYEYVQYGIRRSILAGQARTRLFEGRVKLDAAVIRESDLPVDESDIQGFGLPPYGLAVESESMPTGRENEERGTGRHQLGTVRLALTPVSRVHITGEMGISRLDMEEQSEEAGRAGTLLGTLDPAPVALFGRDLGTVEFSGSYRYVAPQFRPMGRTQRAEEARRWGEDLSTSLDGETREARAVYRLTPHSGVELEYGKTHRPSGTSATRDGARVWSPRGAYEIERVGRIGSGTQSTRILRQRGRLEHMLPRLRPEIRFTSERIEGDLSYLLSSVGSEHARGIRDREIEAALSSVDWGPAFWSSGYGFRRTWRQTSAGDGAWMDSLSIRSQRHELKLNPWRSLSGAAVYSRRHNRTHDASGASGTTELITFEVRGAPLNRALWGEIHYDHTNTQFMRKTRHFIDVGDGRGAYLWEDRNRDGQQQEEEFVPDPEGRYILYIQDVSTSEPVAERSAGLTIRTTPSRILESATSAQTTLWRRAFSALSSESVVELSRKAHRDETFGPFDLYRFRTGDSILRARRRLHHDLHLLRYGRAFSARFRYRRNDDLNREFSSGEDRTRSVERSVRTRFMLPRDVGLEVEYGRDRSERQGRGTFDFDLDSEEIHLSGTYSPVQHTKIQLTLRGRRDQDRHPAAPTTVRLFSVEPEISRSLGAIGRLRLEADWAHVTSDPEGAQLVFQMADGNQQGHTLTWRCSLDYRLGQYVTARGSYYGRKLPDRETTHTMRAEVSALF